LTWPLTPTPRPYQLVPSQAAMLLAAAENKKRTTGELRVVACMRIVTIASIGEQATDKRHTKGIDDLLDRHLTVNVTEKRSLCDGD